MGMSRDSVAHRNPDHDQHHKRVAQDQRLALWRLGRTVEEEGRGHLVRARAWTQAWSRVRVRARVRVRVRVEKSAAVTWVDSRCTTNY